MTLMALDNEYFDNIHIEVAKKKYYNANKVEALLADIRRQAEELNAENARLRAELAEAGDKRVELGEAVISAQAIYNDIIDRANLRASEIVAEAEKQRDRIKAESERMQDYSVQRVEACFDQVRQQHLAAVEEINAAWQAFLVDLYQEDKPQPAAPAPKPAASASNPAAPAPPPPQRPRAIQQAAATQEAAPAAPADLEDKVDAIARALQAFHDET